MTRVFYQRFWSGLGGGQLLHAALDGKTGISVFDHPYECRFLFGQCLFDQPQGVIPADEYQSGIRTHIPVGEFLNSENNRTYKELRDIPPSERDMAIVRDVNLSDNVASNLRRIEQYCRDHPRRVLVLVHDDIAWMREFASQFPEYIDSRLTPDRFRPQSDPGSGSERTAAV